MASNVDNKMTLVLGGTGKTGRRVAERLNKRGLAVRIGSRSGNPTFDWNEDNSWSRALERVHAACVTYRSDLAVPGAAEAVRSLAKLAVEHGVQRLVLLSGRGEEGAQRGERAIRESGAEWTVVRASWFCQNFGENFHLDSVLSRELVFPAGNVAEPSIDAEDIADVAAQRLPTRSTPVKSTK